MSIENAVVQVKKVLSLEELVPLVSDVLEFAERLGIKDTETYQGAAEFRKAIKKLLKDIEETFNPIIEDANRAHRKAIEKRNGFTDKPLRALALVDRKLADYDNEVRRLEREEERKKLDAELAKERAAAALRKAEELAAKGDVAGAEKKLEKAAAQETKATAIAQTIAPPPPRPVVAGTYSVEIWRARIINPGLVPREYCVPDPVALNREARESQGKKAVPGVEFYSTREMRSRG